MFLFWVAHILETMRGIGPGMGKMGRKLTSLAWPVSSWPWILWHTGSLPKTPPYSASTEENPLLVYTSFFYPFYHWAYQVVFVKMLIHFSLEYNSMIFKTNLAKLWTSCEFDFECTVCHYPSDSLLHICNLKHLGNSTSDHQNTTSYPPILE